MYKYNTQVKILKGFYEGSIGIIVRKNPNKDSYVVRFNKCDEAFIDNEDMEKWTRTEYKDC